MRYKFSFYILQTPFVRQNTPHPRELKAKAHKLFTKEQNSLEDSDLQQSETTTSTTTTTATTTSITSSTTTAPIIITTTTAVEAINQHVKLQQIQQISSSTPTPEIIVNTHQKQQQRQVSLSEPPQLPPEPIVGNGAEESSEPSDDTDDVSLFRCYLIKSNNNKLSIFTLLINFY